MSPAEISEEEAESCGWFDGYELRYDMETAAAFEYSLSIIAERDRYCNALASIEPVWLSADEPTACPIHRESQLYDAVATIQHACEYTEAAERASSAKPSDTKGDS